MTMDGEAKSVVQYVLSKNALITPGAAQILATLPNFQAIVDTLLSSGNFFITEDLVRGVLASEEEEGSERLEEEELEVKNGEKEVVVEKTSFKPLAKEYEGNVRVFEEYDVTGKSFCEGTVQDFVRLFRYRFKKLKAILDARPSLSLKPLSRIRKMYGGQEVDIVGMVYEKRESKTGKLLIELEDEEDRVTVVFSPENADLFRRAQFILPDDVIAVKGKVTNGGMVVANEFYWPDLEPHIPHTSETGLAVAITSDWHVGSKLFIEKAAEKFIKWLRGEIGGERLRELAGRVKYLIVNGDLVDGVGVYPSQIDELVIKDIYKQYEEFARWMEKVPDYIEIIITPGNHDAVRRLEPQPAIPEDIAEPLYEIDNVYMLGSPTYVALDGVEFMIYHGTSLDEVISRVPGLTYEQPQEAIHEYLRRRVLIPTYGVKQPIVPERRDYMLIDRVPDVLTVGHVHKNGYTIYKGVRGIVSGTFQDQTPFQLQMGHVPTPGHIPILTLDDLKVHELKVIE